MNNAPLWSPLGISLPFLNSCAMSEYEDGYYDRQNRYGRNSYQSGQAVGSLLGLGLGAIIKLVPLAVRLAGKALVGAPYLVLGLGATSLLPSFGPGLTDARLLVAGALAYGCFLGLYWLKGVTLGLRRRGARWGLPLLLVLVLGCLVPALLLHGGIALTLPAPGMVLFTWVVPVVLAGYAYYQLRPSYDYAPALALWAYRMGYQTGLK